MKNANENICEHLRPILNFELNAGNSIKEVSTGWSIAKRVIQLEKKMNIDCILEKFNLDAYISYWENHDSHYPIEKGFFCELCENSLSGPM